jgi:CRISPR type III-A-associated protein Csm2
MDMKDAVRKAGLERRAEAGGGYFDGQGHLRPEFVSKQGVEPLARKFAEEKLNMAQLRRFFNHCREIERRLRSKQTTWEEERTNVAKLAAFAADAAGKSPPKIPRSFLDFIDRNVGAVRTERDFLDGFMEHFEALVGFSALYMREERTR